MQSSSWREEIMANFEAEDGTKRDDLVQRVALMEEMIAAGRRSTLRFGWIFVLWGLIDLAPVGWQLVVPNSRWVMTWSGCGIIPTHPSP